jgi:hypothetical protein
MPATRATAAARPLQDARAPASARGTAAARLAAVAARLRLAAVTARLGRPDIAIFARRWAAIFGGTLVLFIVRFLVPSPVGMADNGDGPRLMCGLGVAPVTNGATRYDGFAYFAFQPSSSCSGASVYPSSQHVLLLAARALTPLLGLSGAVNLIALGIVTCALQSAGIASLACGLRLSLRNTLRVAGVLWLVMADAAFFDTYASPYSEGATLTGLLLVAAGVLYLGRGPLSLAFGLVLCGGGGYLAILSKEQYLALAIPVCIAILLMSADWTRHGLARMRTPRTAAACLVAGLLAVAAIAAAHQDSTSRYGLFLHQEQVVDVVFDDIVNGHDNAAADLHALGLPAAWSKYAGDGFWSTPSVYHDPLYPRYADRLTDTNLAHFLLTHPADLVSISQQSAEDALMLRVSYLGNYAPSAGHPVGTLENRITVLSSIVQAIPAGLGLFWLVPLWAGMVALALWTLRRTRAARWHRDASLGIVMLAGCAVAAFGPAAYFAGVETTRHMLGMNLATALACVLAGALFCSMIRSGIVSGGPDGQAVTEVPRQADPRDAVTAGRMARTGPARHGRPPARRFSIR